VARHTGSHLLRPEGCAVFLGNGVGRGQSVGAANGAVKFPTD
jgi:hypothetical protein